MDSELLPPDSLDSSSIISNWILKLTLTLHIQLEFLDQLCSFKEEVVSQPEIRLVFAIDS